MSTEMISTTFVELGATTALIAIGYLLGTKMTLRRLAKKITSDERRFHCYLELAKVNTEMHLNAYKEDRQHLERKASYEQLAKWLIQLERTLDEIYAGVVTSTHRDVREKVELMLRGDVWNIIVPPEELCFAGLYWSSEVRALIRKIHMPYSVFVNKAIKLLDGQEGSELWGDKQKVFVILAEIRDQARSDLGIA
ncbi:hypothetical protein ACQEU6_38710 [Spirillospora sp. CA-108201]